MVCTKNVLLCKKWKRKIFFILVICSKKCKCYLIDAFLRSERQNQLCCEAIIYFVWFIKSWVQSKIWSNIILRISHFLLLIMFYWIWWYTSAAELNVCSAIMKLSYYQNFILVQIFCGILIVMLVELYMCSSIVELPSLELGPLLCMPNKSNIKARERKKGQIESKIFKL